MREFTIPESRIPESLFPTTLPDNSDGMEECEPIEASGEESGMMEEVAAAIETTSMSRSNSLTAPEGCLTVSERQLWDPGEES